MKLHQLLAGMFLTSFAIVGMLSLVHVPASPGARVFVGFASGIASTLAVHVARSRRGTPR